MVVTSGIFLIIDCQNFAGPENNWWQKYTSYNRYDISPHVSMCSPVSYVARPWLVLIAREPLLFILQSIISLGFALIEPESTSPVNPKTRFSNINRLRPFEYPPFSMTIYYIFREGAGSPSILPDFWFRGLLEWKWVHANTAVFSMPRPGSNSVKLRDIGRF